MKIFSLLGIWEIYQLKTNKRNEGKYFETEVQNGHKVVKENFHHTSNMVRNSWKNKDLYLKRL